MILLNQELAMDPKDFVASRADKVPIAGSLDSLAALVACRQCLSAVNCQFFAWSKMSSPKLCQLLKSYQKANPAAVIPARRYRAAMIRTSKQVCRGVSGTLLSAGAKGVTPV